MKKLLFILVIIIAGCSMDTEDYTLDYTYTPTHYLKQPEYETLLDNLESLSYVDRSVIDGYLDAIGVDRYEYSYYSSGEYKCYTFHWDKFSEYSYDWIYYIDVDIWTVNGVLRRSMCNYYSD